MSRVHQFISLLAADYRAHYRYKDEERRRAAIRFLPRLIANPSLHAVLLVRLITVGPAWLTPLWRNILLAKHSSDVSAHMVIGPGLDLPHPWGIVLGSVTLGSNCVIYHNVTMGVRAPHLVPVRGVMPDLPILGDNVVVYCGALILGNAHVGDRSVVGAQAIVTQDIPADSVAGVARPVETQRAQSST